jgi:probable F420-dependent oxidoreductase
MPQRRFRFGVINESMYPADAWLSHVRHIEALGYAIFLIRDHFVPDFFGDQYAPIVALMAAANATTTLRIGSLVLDNDYRHPAMLAKEAATVDVLSGGRFELGMGAGWLRKEYEQAGLPYDAAGLRISRLEEALTIIKRLWAPEPLTFTGQHYRIQALDGVPKPAQQRRPPILIGCGHQRMLRLAGREADIVSILTTSVATGTVIDDPRERFAAAVQQKIDWLRAGAGDRFSEIELSLIPSVLIADHRRQATEQLIAERGWSGIAVEDVWDMPSLLIGSEEQIVDDLLHRRERYGFSYYVVSDRRADEFAPIVAQLAGQ